MTDSASDVGSSRPPNILLIVSDEERRTDWLDGYADLPAHDRLAADGTSFTNHYTHASPCSPSRASLYTGRYLWQHGVVDNVSFAAHKTLDPADTTMGQRMRDLGYESAYFGKWHLSLDKSGGEPIVEPGWTLEPDMELYGYSGWSGNDRHYTGAAWTGRHFDPIIAGQAIDWIEQHADDERPWFATVALVNPHDIMWYPADQPSYLAANPDQRSIFEFMRSLAVGDLELSAPGDYAERFDTLPANFFDDLHSKPEVQRAWRQVRNTEHMVGHIDLDDHVAWLRQLDYYAWLHERLDDTLAQLLGTLDRLGIYDDTTIIYT
ncbi:MAG: sulfatase-like hydrolase/transferase, partial [Acidimicrobiales bacterium]|nr:sulfatase-like hydrolase/transferase [Acidimicrobiales bacterium]